MLHLVVLGLLGVALGLLVRLLWSRSRLSDRRYYKDAHGDWVFPPALECVQAPEMDLHKRIDLHHSTALLLHQMNPSLFDEITRQAERRYPPQREQSADKCTKRYTTLEHPTCAVCTPLSDLRWVNDALATYRTDLDRYSQRRDQYWADRALRKQLRKDGFTIGKE